MGWTGSSFVRVGGSSNWADDRDAAVEIEAGLHDTHDEDLAQGINECINKNGANAATADISMGGNKLQNLANAAADGDAVNFSLLAIRQIQIATLLADHSNSSTTYGASGLAATITPHFSDSKLLICVSAPVVAQWFQAPDAASRFGTYQIYRSTGTAAGIMEAAAGRITASAGVAYQSYTPVFMMATETPGAGTHTYQFRHKSAAASVRSTVLGASNQAVMAILECRP